MFEFLEGEVEQLAHGVAVLSQGGIGWRIAISGRSAERLRQHQPARLFVHLAVSDSALSLYGFCEDAERALFRRLLHVNGVGPGTALSLLSALSPEELASAVLEGDSGRLTAVRGVGRKTADRLIVELRDHIASLAPAEPGIGRRAGEDLVRVLVDLGFNPREAGRRAAAAHRALGSDAGFQELLRTALGHAHNAET